MNLVSFCEGITEKRHILLIKAKREVGVEKQACCKKKKTADPS